MGETVKTDFLVIGSGIAGLSFAIQASKHGSVAVATKKELMESNTNLAQGGIAAVLGKNDSFKLHINDTLKVGCGLCNREAVETLVRNGPGAINWLINQGVEFDRGKSLALSMESGHSRRRIAHKGDYTGREIEEALVASVRQNGIHTYENCLALDLIVKDGRCYGAKILNLKEETPLTFLAKATVLATGGIGQIFGQTSNPYIATGDGVAMAYRAGARLEDMEFIQFHPTTIQRKGEPNFLISETVRGEGGILRDASGEAFMGKYDAARELAPRDIVSRAVFEELKRGKIYLDLTHRRRSYILRRFPTIYAECLRQGIDVTEEQIPVVPAAHYLCGGIKVNLSGESSIRGLFAFGECSATGVHGANRLASNSLLESVVFSLLGAEKAQTYLSNGLLTTPPEAAKAAFDDCENGAEELKKELQSLMWNNVGIVRSNQSLTYAASQLKRLKQKADKLNGSTLHAGLIELQNMLTISSLITEAASLRKESRGTHYMAEYPVEDDANWLRHIAFQGAKVEVV